MAETFGLGEEASGLSLGIAAGERRPNSRIGERAVDENDRGWVALSSLWAELTGSSVSPTRWPRIRQDASGIGQSVVAGGDGAPGARAAASRL